MSITKEDILELSNRHEQLSMFEYWSADEDQQHKDHVGKTPLEMVREYHDTAGLDKDVDLSKETLSHLLKMRLDLIEEEFEEFVKEHWHNGFFRTGDEIDREKVLKELSDLVYVAYGYAVTWGWDLDEAVRRVHENNMGRMYQPNGTIKRRADGKILKNKGYPAVDLSDLV